MNDGTIDKWDWQFVTEYVRAYDSNEVELIVHLGFNMRAHMRFKLEGIEHLTCHSPSPTHRAAARRCNDFINEILSKAKNIIVHSTRIELTNNYMGNIMYQNPEDETWYFLSNEMLSSGVLERIV